MQYEPDINRGDLIHILETEYGITVVAMQFIPMGFGAVCYKIQCADGTTCFCKVWLDAHRHQNEIVRRHVGLHLSRALRERSLFPYIPVPIMTENGTAWVERGSIAVALFPFIEGDAPPHPIPHPIRDNWARAMATIHRATPALHDVLPPPETFDIPFESVLLRSVESLLSLDTKADAGMVALRDVIVPYRDDINAQLNRLHHLQSVVHQLSGPTVLCHTDMNGDNLLIEANGTLWVLDWDWTVVAPPEYDLFLVVREDFAAFLNAYRMAGGIADLHLDHFAFALLRRYMGDLTARVVRILEENPSPDEAEAALEGIMTWGIEPWERLDVTLLHIAQVLHR